MTGYGRSCLDAFTLDDDDFVDDFVAVQDELGDDGGQLTKWPRQSITEKKLCEIKVKVLKDKNF